MNTAFKGLVEQIGNKKVIASLLVGLFLPSLVKIVLEARKNRRNRTKYQGAKYVGIQLGGTNYNVAIGQPVFNKEGNIINFKIIKRSDGVTYQKDPRATLDDIKQFIAINDVDSQGKTNTKSYYFIGIASFGPLCLNIKDPRFGSITSTPKQKWRGVEIHSFFANQFRNSKVGIDTDVNAAAFAQFRIGNHDVRESLVYVTVGTGVGVGVVAQGKTIHGLTHPQGGHIIVQRHPEEYEGFVGVCPYHAGKCLEGLVCNKSIALRLNIPFTELHKIADHEKVWKILGNYLAQLCLNITLLVSPQVIVIGGGIMNRKILYDYIRKQFLCLLAEYVEIPLFTAQNIGRYIVSPNLGSDVGIKGAMILDLMSNE